MSFRVVIFKLDFSWISVLGGDAYIGGLVHHVFPWFGFQHQYCDVSIRFVGFRALRWRVMSACSISVF